MAVFNNRLWIEEATAAADLRALQYHAVKLSGARTVVMANSATSTLATAPWGILQNKPNSGQSASVLVLGESKIVAGAALATVGVLLTVNTSGRAAAATGSNQIIFGQLIDAAAADGEVVTARIFPPYRMGDGVI